jgi:hypothetical protein
MPPRRPGRQELADARDGLTRSERIVLTTLAELSRERPGSPVPTAMLHGRVVERLDLSVAELIAILRRLGIDAPG